MAEKTKIEMKVITTNIRLVRALAHFNAPPNLEVGPDLGQKHGRHDGRDMKLTTKHAHELLRTYDCRATEICATRGRLLGPVGIARAANRLLTKGKLFSTPTSRNAPVYQGFRRDTGKRCAKQAVNAGVQLSVHLKGSSNSRNVKKLDARPCEVWARAKNRSGREHPHFLAAWAPKNAIGVVPAHCRCEKECVVQLPCNLSATLICCEAPCA